MVAEIPLTVRNNAARLKDFANSLGFKTEAFPSKNGEIIVAIINKTLTYSFYVTESNDVFHELKSGSKTIQQGYLPAKEVFKKIQRMFLYHR